MLDISSDENSSACKKHGCFHKIFVDAVDHFLVFCQMPHGSVHKIFLLDVKDLKMNYKLKI
jgi:hypothetical protein